jgi:hypothetical protein
MDARSLARAAKIIAGEIASIAKAVEGRWHQAKMVLRSIPFRCDT